MKFYFKLQVLLTEPPLNPSKNRAKMIEVSLPKWMNT